MIQLIQHETPELRHPTNWWRPPGLSWGPKIGTKRWRTWIFFYKLCMLEVTKHVLLFVMDSLRNWENKTEYKHIRQKNKRQNRTHNRKTRNKETWDWEVKDGHSKLARSCTHFFKKDGQTKHMLNQPKQMSLWPGYIPRMNTHSCKPCMTTHPKHTYIALYTWRDMTWRDMTWRDMTWHYKRTYMCKNGIRSGRFRSVLSRCFLIIVAWQIWWGRDEVNWIQKVTPSFHKWTPV